MAKLPHLYLSIVLCQVLVLFAFPLLLSFFLKKNLRELFPFRKISWPFFIAIVGLAFSLDVVLEYVLWLSESYFPSPLSVTQNLHELLTITSTSELFAKLALLCVLPAITEEFCFRGFLQTSFSTKYGWKYGLLLSSFLFALLHGNFSHIHIYFMLGVWFGTLRLLSGSLLPGMLSHFFNNAWTIFLSVANIEVPLFPKQAQFDLIIFAAAFSGAAYCARKLWSFSRDFSRT